MKYIKAILFFCLIAVAISIAVVTYFLFSVGYNEFIIKAANALNKPDWVAMLSVKFSYEKFRAAKTIVAVLDIAFVVLSILVIVKRKQIFNLVARIYSSYANDLRLIIKDVKQTTIFEKSFLIGILLMVFVKALYTNHYQSLWYDEMWTYNNFLNGGYWKAILFPGNNHRIYTLIAWPFVQLPFDTQLMMRLPNMLTGLFTIIAFYLLTFKRFSKPVVYIGLSWFAFCYLIGTFMVIARAYIFVSLFTIIFLSACLKIVEQKQTAATWFTLFGAFILGYWSNYVFFLGHFCVFTYVLVQLLLNHQFSSLKKFIIIQFFAGFILLILAMPDIVSGHIGAVMKHDNFIMNSDPHFIQSLFKNAWFTLGYQKLDIIYLSIPIAAILLSRKPSFSQVQKFLSFQCAFAMYFILVWDTIKHTLTTHHIVIYLTIFVALAIMLILEAILKKLWLNKSLIISAAIAIFIFSTYGQFHNSWFNWGKQYDLDNKQMASTYLDNKVKKLYISYNYFKPAAVFYSGLANKLFVIDMYDIASADHKVFDSKNFEYGGIIQDNKKPLPVDTTVYKAFLVREGYTAFIKK